MRCLKKVAKQGFLCYNVDALDENTGETKKRYWSGEDKLKIYIGE